MSNEAWALVFLLVLFSPYWLGHPCWHGGNTRDARGADGDSP